MCKDHARTPVAALPLPAKKKLQAAARKQAAAKVDQLTKEAGDSAKGPEPSTADKTKLTKQNVHKHNKKHQTGRMRGKSKWEVMHSNQGVTYYWNKEDNTTQYEKPDDFDGEEDDEWSHAMASNKTNKQDKSMFSFGGANPMRR